MIPVGILSGFLGSGKTTRLRRLLQEPDMSGTAVVVNEFGVVGIDHELLETGEDQTILLSNGCLCCSARSGLENALRTLWSRARRGEIDVERVVVETSGLADPLAVLQLIGPGGPMSGMFSRGHVVVTVDVGLETLEGCAEARQQVIFADRIKLTKLDAHPLPLRLVTLIRALNPTAAIDGSDADELSRDDLFGSRKGEDFAAPLGEYLPRESVGRDHLRDVRAIAIIEERPLPAALMSLFLEGLSANAGSRLLRVKGILNVAGAADYPIVVQGTSHRKAEVTRLSTWPSPDRRTRISIIGRGLPDAWPQLLFQLLWAELEEIEHNDAACSRQL
jgi:G3E family GTPase